MYNFLGGGGGGGGGVALGLTTFVGLNGEGVGRQNARKKGKERLL